MTSSVHVAANERSSAPVTTMMAMVVRPVNNQEQVLAVASI